MATVRARRYARAVFGLAQEQGDLDGWAKRVEAVKAVLTQPDVHQVLANPSIAPSERIRVVESIARDRLDEGALNLARLLVAARAIDSIEDIAAAYGALQDEAEGRVRATAVAAVELPADEWQRVSRELSRRLGREVQLESRVDPRVIGGVLLEIGDRVIDATVAGRLSQLRRALTSA